MATRSVRLYLVRRTLSCWSSLCRNEAGKILLFSSPIGHVSNVAAYSWEGRRAPKAGMASSFSAHWYGSRSTCGTSEVWPAVRQMGPLSVTSIKASCWGAATLWQNLSKLLVEFLVAKIQLTWPNCSSGDSGQNSESFRVEAWLVPPPPRHR